MHFLFHSFHNISTEEISHRDVVRLPAMFVYMMNSLILQLFRAKEKPNNRQVDGGAIVRCRKKLSLYLNGLHLFKRGFVVCRMPFSQPENLHGFCTVVDAHKREISGKRKSLVFSSSSSWLCFGCRSGCGT